MVFPRTRQIKLYLSLIGLFSVVVLYFWMVPVEMDTLSFAMKSNHDSDATDAGSSMYTDSIDSITTKTEAESANIQDRTKIGLNGPTFLLVRSISNNLEPLELPGHNVKVLKYILENELEYPGVTKLWVVNRIADSEVRDQIFSELIKYAADFLEIPFVLEDYAKVENIYHGIGYGNLETDNLRDKKFFQKLTPRKQAEVMDAVLADKNIYAINENGARNYMIEQGVRGGQQWILPWDGNCILTTSAFVAIQTAVRRFGRATKYMYVPGANGSINQKLTQANLINNTKAYLEAQLILRRDARERFDLRYRYGRRSKIQLFKRLKIRGVWDKYTELPWEPKAPGFTTDNMLGGKHVTIPAVGFVINLADPKNKSLEIDKDHGSDGSVRKRASVRRLVDLLDARVAVEINKLDTRRMAYYDEDIISKERTLYQAAKKKKLASPLVGLVDSLITCAENAMEFGPFSVTNKSELPPGGDRQDYYSPAPYFWPDPDQPDGLPFMRVDGKRVPGTDLYDEQSNKFDRSRLSSFYGNTTCLSLGFYFSDDDRFAKKAAQNLRAWFVDPKTKMNPNCKYAQIQWGHNDNVGANYGVIETKDFYFFLDAIRIIERTTHLNQSDGDTIRKWFADFLSYLRSSDQGRLEFFHHNNHGTFFDVQAAAIASYVGDVAVFLRHTEYAKSRIISQFSDDGSMPGEMIRPTQLHYMMFALQGWYTLARIAEKGGVDLWHYKKPWNADKDLVPIKMTTVYTVPEFNHTWTHHQAKSEEMRRMIPLYYCAIDRYPELEALKAAPHYAIKDRTLYGTTGVFFAHYGIPYYWNLGLSKRGMDEEKAWEKGLYGWR